MFFSFQILSESDAVVYQGLHKVPYPVVVEAGHVKVKDISSFWCKSRHQFQSQLE